MNEPRLLLTLLALLLPSFLWIQWVESRGAVVAFELEQISYPVAGFQPARDAALTQEVLDQIAPDAYVNRVYERARGDSIYLYLALYRAATTVGAHDPAACYPAQGWEIARSWNVDLPLAEDSLRARAIRVSQGEHEELVLYWFQPAGRWPGVRAWEEVLRVYDGLRGEPQYAFVRISAPIEQGRDPMHDLESFAKELAPRVRSVVENPRPQGQLRDAAELL